MIRYFLGKTSTDKFRWFCIECDEEWHDNGYIIQRSYGQVGGKTTLSPAIIVDKTKQKRTWKEQVDLQFNSECKKILDKGYKETDLHPNTYSEEELQEIFGDVKTNQYGVIKPQLAKQADKVTNKKIFDKQWLISRKLDGVKALFYFKDGEVVTSSRGGEDYNLSTVHIRENQRLIEFFEDHPNVILDGELYCHHKTLQQISGAARLEKNAYDNDWLEYWVYDCYIIDNPEMIAIDRWRFLTENLPALLCNGDNATDKAVVKLLEHTLVQGWENMMNLHNHFVEEGFEGAVITDPEKAYKPGSRGNQLIKIKKYRSEDFLVVGYKLGLRGSEDMTFTCQLEDGRTFEAMPCGTREEKQEYIDNFENKYKNKLGECTFFNYSEDGIPTQPKFRVFRWDLM